MIRSNSLNQRKALQCSRELYVSHGWGCFWWLTLGFWKIIEVAAARVQWRVMKMRWRRARLRRVGWVRRGLCVPRSGEEKSPPCLFCTASGTTVGPCCICYLWCTFSWGNGHLRCFWSGQEQTPDMEWAVWFFAVLLFHCGFEQPLDSVWSANGKAISQRARCCLSGEVSGCT